MRWTDIYDIAASLSECHPEVDPKQINFVDLRDWILDLDGFDDNPNHCGERILEGIQMAWIDELS
jgi:FeS assembly protein IscX|tara:strand:- start:1388 stop:1582 length:195 start_codon:yes stop_codon:yes gene_type:complete